MMACPEHGAVAAVHMEPSSTRERRSGTDSGTGLLYSHDTWAGPGTVGWKLCSMWRDTFPPPPPPIAVAIHPIRHSKAGHPDGWRTAHSANTYRDPDTVRWSMWNAGRVRSLGDGVPGTWYGFGCTVCTVCTKCAQSVHKNVHKVCTKDKCAHFVTRVHNKND